MAYVKLDCGILDSTLWIERECREVFITALLMAKPREFHDPIPQIEVDSTNRTGWEAPPGWYGFVEAAGPGIVRRAGVDVSVGIEALRRLGQPDPESRTPDHDGRRMIRCDGGYLILNFDRYREKDHTAPERARRYRDKQKLERHAVTSRSHTPKHPFVTQAEAEAEAITPLLTTPSQAISRGSPEQPAAGVPPADAGKATPVAKGLSLEALRVTPAVGTVEHDAAGELWAVLSANGCKGTASHPAVIEMARSGVGVDDLRAAIAEARKAKDGPLNPAYLAAIVERMRSSPKGNGKAAAWATDDGACEAKARELGLWPARGGESWDELRGRIRAKIAKRAEESVR